MIKAIIFDFDGTLVKMSDRAYYNHIATAVKLGLRLPNKKKFFKHFGKPWNKVIKSLWPEASIYRFKKVHFKLHYENVKKFHGPKPINGLRKTLSRLKRKGYRLFIISSRDKKSLARNIVRLKIDSYIDLYHAMEHSRHHKPDPRVFKPVYRKTKLKNHELLYVGDLPSDYDAAKRANILFIGVTSGLTKKKQFLKAGLKKFFILKSINELPAFLKGWKND